MTESFPMALTQGPGPVEDADLILIERFARGDAGAYDLIVRRHQARVSALVYRLLVWPPEVEDVVQEVFLAALRGLPGFNRRCTLATWLTRIAINKCRAHRRRRLWSWRLWLDHAGHRRDRSGTDAAPAADRHALDHEKFERVRRAVDRLPTLYREAVVLRYLEQLSVEEIAEVLSVRSDTLQVRLHRARNLLREHLADLVKE